MSIENSMATVDIVLTHRSGSLCLVFSRDCKSF
jgi:hypothetical protein